MSAPQDFSEEELAQLEAEMEKLTPDDILIQSLVTLINLGARKAGLATPPGEQGPKRDLEQTRQAIDGARAIIPLLEERHARELAGVKDALAQLQRAFVQLSGGEGEAAPPSEPEPPKPGEAGPAQSSGRLWIPGQ